MYLTCMSSEVRTVCIFFVEKKRFISNFSSSVLSSTFKVVVAANKRWPGLSEVRIVVSNETAAFGVRAEGR